MRSRSCKAAAIPATSSPSTELCTQEAKGVIYDLCAAIDVHRFADRSGGIELRLRCRDGLLEFTIPGIAARCSTGARVHSPRARHRPRRSSNSSAPR